jgi:Protein of unknown function (DUF2975)
MRRSNISLTAIIIAAAFTIYFFFFNKSILSGSTGPFPMDWSINIPEEDTAFGGLFFDPEINDSLPHYQYKRIEDSIKQIKEGIKLKNKSIGSGKVFGTIGIMEINKDWSFSGGTDSQKDIILKSLLDSMNLLGNKMIGLERGDSFAKIEKLSGEVLWRYNVRSNEILQQNKLKQERLYYLGLEGYRIKDYNTQFFLDNGTYNLAYVVWDSVHKRAFDSTKSGHYERKRISIRYSADDKRLMIPLTKKQYRVTSTIFNLCWYALAFLFVYIFIGLPFQIIINISKGQAFTLKNIYRFKLMAIVLLIYGLMAIAMPYLLKLFYNKIIPEDFALKPFTQTFFSYLPLLLSALGLLLISKAFKRGYKLQQENALTI